MTARKDTDDRRPEDRQIPAHPASPNDTPAEVDRHDKAVEAMQNDDGTLAEKLPKAREQVDANPGPDNPQINQDGNVRGTSKEDQVKDDLAVEKLTGGEDTRRDGKQS